MPTYKTKLIILARRDYLEADRLLTVYSLAKGKHTIIAKGSRKTLAKLGGKIEPYYQLFAMLVEGKSFDILVEGEILKVPDASIIEEKKLHSAYQISRLINQLFRDFEGSQRVFHLLDEVLYPLTRTSWPLFLGGIIGQSGFAPDLKACDVCQQSLELPLAFSGQYGFRHAHCSQSLTPLTDQEAKLLKIALQNSSLLAKLVLDDRALARLELLLEEYISYHEEIEFKQKG